MVRDNAAPVTSLPAKAAGRRAALGPWRLSVLSFGALSVLLSHAASASEFDDMGDRSTAQLRKLDREIALHPGQSQGYVNRGEFYGKANFEDKAVADFRRAIELQPNNYDAYFKRGEFEMQIDEYKGALADYLRAAQFAPDSEKGSPFRHAGRAQIKLHAYADGVKTLTSSLRFEQAPTRHLTLKERAICFLALHRYKEAIADINAMNHGQPIDGDEALAIRAEAELEIGQTRAAIDDLTAALKTAKKRPASFEKLVFSNDSSAYYKLRARCYKKLGQDALAAADLKSASGVEKESLDFAPFR